MTQLVPQQQRKLLQVLASIEKANWHKSFKKEWKKLETHIVQNTYFTDVSNWVCGYSSFLTSRFFICKHLVLQKGTVPIKFFDQVHCHHQYPFLSTLDIQVSTSNISQFISHNDNITNFNVIEDEESVQNSDKIYTRLINTTKKILEILEDQQNKKNYRWVKNVEKNFRPIEKMADEITSYK
ncbi:12522_t:CDS:1 [Gigaspora margarita]|uniref:12522_t:CDS:1 n=1 Tax=Gigaspora margarita TaxID=4874 RepID=A0ABM8W726_GIGMA|nr:12522_t:CDS:1 [Gigaspora margarita]